MRIFLGLIATLAIVGCATLPNAERVIKEAESISGTPPILSAKGWLSEKRSETLLDHAEGATDTLARFNKVMELVSKSPLTAGNKITLLENGPATLDAMFKVIDSAKDSINIETFIFDDDKVGRKFKQALLQKAKAGVQVNVMYDSRGSSANPKSFFDGMEDGGVNVLEYNPGNPLKARGGKWKLFHPDHRKLLVVDGKVAITGGINISGVYSSQILGRSALWAKEEKITDGKDVFWRDTDVLVEGPAVAELQKMFMENWKDQKGPELSTRDYLPKLEDRGDMLVRILGTSHGADNRLSYLSYYAAIKFAERSVHLTNAYFLPDEQLLQDIMDAAKRGVDVKLILPEVTDSRWARNASHYNYADLMAAGVKIYELRGEFLHAKTAVIDGVWSNVGSSNLDTWSMERSDELDTVVLSPTFAAQMESVFNSDLKKCDAIDPKKWSERKVSKKIAEWLAHVFRFAL